MPDENPDLRLEIAHVLFMDVVGFSKLLTNEQSDLLRDLNQVVRETEEVKDAEAENKLVILPTGDGMALVFFTRPDAPVRCALQISRAIAGHAHLPLRMGAHSGPVAQVVDVNLRANVAGAGITLAQRVMDCGDAGHILLSKRIADDLAQISQWTSHLHDLGDFEIKHGDRIGIVNLLAEGLGNPALPEKLRAQDQVQASPPAKSSPVAPASPRRGLLIWIALVLALLSGGLWLVSHLPPRRTEMVAALRRSDVIEPIPDKRVAVLPFKPIGSENRDQILELGMADTLIAKLSNSRQIVVPSLNSVRRYSALDQDALAAGRELKVSAVVEGNVQKAGDRIRVNARLLNVADGKSVWSDTFDEKFTDVFKVQDTISQKVADALALRLSGDEKRRLTRRYTENLEAYRLYSAGRYHHSKLTPPEIREAIKSFEQAISLDPKYALAYFGLAEAYRSLAITSDIPSKDSLPGAKEAANKAIELDGALAEARASLSLTLVWYDWDWEKAEDEARRALALNPNSGLANCSYAHVLSNIGRHQEALVAAQRAVELEPVYLLFQAIYGMFLHHAGRNEEAEVELQKALTLDSNFWITHLTLGKVYIQQRRYPEALAELTKARELSHGNSEAIATIGYAAAISGDGAKAREILDELKGLANRRYVPPIAIALVYNGLGDKTEAVFWLERACEERDVRLSLLRVDPKWDSLRGDPRFIAILKRIGLQ